MPLRDISATLHPVPRTRMEHAWSTRNLTSPRNLVLLQHRGLLLRSDFTLYKSVCDVFARALVSRTREKGIGSVCVGRELPSYVEECDFSEAILKRARTIKRTWRSTGVIHKTIRARSAVSNAVEGLDSSMNLNPCHFRLHL